MVDWAAKFLNNTYKKTRNFTAKLREFLRLAVYNKVRADEKNVYVTYNDWQKKPWKKRQDASCCMSEKLHSKALTNLVIDGKFLSGLNVTDDILKEIRKKINTSRHSRLFETRFSNVSRNKKVTKDSFYILLYKKGKFVMLDGFFTSEKQLFADLQKILISTIGIYENKDSIPTPTNSWEIWMDEKEKS